MPLERIQKILAEAGIASRREAERMMIEGRVTVNGQVVDTLGYKADPSKDHIKIDGKRLKGFELVELGYPEKAAIEEASRCLRCDLEED